MSKAYEIRFRATRAEYERLFQEAHLHGHKTLSGYFRNRCFGLGFHVEEKVIENNRILKRVEAELLDSKPKPKYRTVTSRNNIQETPQHP